MAHPVLALIISSSRKLRRELSLLPSRVRGSFGAETDSATEDGTGSEGL